jgi:hypothetical protein
MHVIVFQRELFINMAPVPAAASGIIIIIVYGVFPSAPAYVKC